ncbi:MAG: M14-type cytosolic carboxypeptidase [Gammaproteobacteria bacterium]|nr:M14-type cytosolic carboxypeptidase [Gammaproteobacteria bacterium]
MHISQDFDAGNIEVVSAASADDIQLRIRHDQDSEFYQWFYFRLSGVRDVPCTLKILNAAGAAYPAGFEDYRVVYSYDRQHWRRYPTTLEGGELRIEITPQQDAMYFAYFTPYSMERHADLAARSLQSPLCNLTVLGQSVDGQDIDLLRIAGPGDASGRKNCWLIARQHPGESMAQWWMEGALERLVDPFDEFSAALLQRCNFFVVPNMNPDGSRRGHLRTNAVGRNLNREWAAPSMEMSPEVYLVSEAMTHFGVDFFLDVHGDESLPYCFIAGVEGLAGWTAEDQAKLDFYKTRLAEINDDFQTEVGYPTKGPGEANLSMSTGFVGSRFGCLAMTLEMPFKDTTATPDPEFGWSGERSKALAHSCLEALAAAL